MAFNDPYSSLLQLPLGSLFQSYLPDFVLAFAFFAALAYVVLGRRLEHQRPAIVMSAAVGMALAIGLVWWEQDTGRSIRNLGPVAVGLGVILLGMILFQGIRVTGGSWAGAGIALGGRSLLVGWMLGMQWPVATGIIQTLAMVGLTVGIVAFMLHHKHDVTHVHPLPRDAVMDSADVRHDMSDLYTDRHAEDRLRNYLDGTREECRHLAEHPQDAGKVMERLRRLIPAEGWLTERLAQLRAKAHLVREGHAHRLQELEQFIGTLPAPARKALSADLATRYKAVVGTDQRLERLDLAVAEIERRIRALTAEAQEALARYDYAKLYDLMDQAEKLQKHNDHLLKTIEHTEKKLTHLIEAVAAEAAKVSQR